MTKQIVKGALIGGVVFFFWGMFSHMVLPWHNWTLKTFNNEAPVRATLEANAPADGVYIIPNFYGTQSTVAQDEQMKIMQEFFFFGVVRKSGSRSFGTMLGVQFLANVAACALMS